MATCGSTQASYQAFDFVTEGNFIVVRAAPSKCVNIEAYGTTPGAQVWLYGCMGAGYTCEGNCDWESYPSNAPGSNLFRNNESKLCLDDGALPVIPRTCSPGSVSSGLPFCNYSLSFEARAEDLVARLPLDYKLALIMLPFPVAPAQLAYPPLDIAAFFWDMTMIHGLSFFPPGTYDPSLNFTSFPHAIAQAASWDLDLVARITAASAYEARAISQQAYENTQGLIIQSLMAEGGPLANSVHDPRTYGEDPFLLSTMGVTITRVLQNKTSAGFLQVASMSRHFLGFHGATDLPNAGEEWVTPQWLVEHHLPAYRALMVEGEAEAIMCSCNTMRVGGGDGSSGGIPACVHPVYYHILRNVWNSSAVVQADNEAIFPMWQDHHYFKTLEEAMAGFLTAGGVAVDSGGGTEIITALKAGLSDGSIPESQIDAAVRRTFLSRFRVGEFDYFNPAMPFRDYDTGMIDGAAHRALAREAAAKTLVLLRNEGGVLPLNPAKPPLSIAVIGPWGNATDRLGNYNHCNQGMEGNYASTTSYVSTIIQAMVDEFPASAGVRVSFVEGSGATTPIEGGVEAASALAASSDLIILALGLGCGVETESRDRSNLRLPQPQAELLAAVAIARNASSTPLIAITVSAGLIDLDELAVDAWISAGYPGEEAGTGLMDVLWGRVSPAGRSPLTGYADDYLGVCGPVADFNLVSETSGVGRTYRYAHKIPQGMIKIPFGTGLSYSTFAYTNLTVTFNPSSVDGRSAASLSVSVTLENTGAWPTASQVTQVYIAPPPIHGVVTPLHYLAAFNKTTPGSVGFGSTLSFDIPYPASFLATLLDGSQMVAGGEYVIFVGGHQPGDERGEAVSNVLNASVTLPSSSIIPPPFPNASPLGYTPST